MFLAFLLINESIFSRHQKPLNIKGSKIHKMSSV